MAAPGPFDLLEIRRLLEPEGAALAAVHAQPSHLARMEEALTAMDGYDGGSAGGLDADRTFHMAIAEASGNAAMPLMLRAIWDIREGTLYRRLEQHFHSEEVWTLARAEHQAVFQAIRSGDARAARSVMLRHVKNAETRFASAWDDDSQENTPEA